MKPAPDAAHVQEWNFDGLIGPTHHYGGLSPGNVASLTHGQQVSNPRAAALEGLAKMRVLSDLGVPQAVVPPLERPALHVLRALGFSGSDEAVLRAAGREAPELLSACASASSMWTANAGTTTPAADHPDGRVHFTPANLLRNFHRAIEAPDTAALWQRLLPASTGRFVHHPPLPGGPAFADEGAANHTRLCPPGLAGPGLHLFVYGTTSLQPEPTQPQRFPARQTSEASAAVARLHGLDPARVIFARQNPAAIDAGVFHNDVIATGHASVFAFHAEAFADTPAVVGELARRWATCYPDAGPLRLLEVTSAELPLTEAVRTYLFNGQLVSVPSAAAGDWGGPTALVLVAPAECRESPAASAVIGRWLADDANPIAEVRYLDLRGSMRNGGGPACLRQRVVLSGAEAEALPPGIRFDAASHGRLADWVRRHYRETLGPGELTSPELLRESRAALDELTGLLGLGSIYPFQRTGG